MAEQTPEQVTAKIVKALFNAGANRWAIQDKGTLVAAVKLQLTEQDTAEATNA